MGGAAWSTVIVLLLCCHRGLGDGFFSFFNRDEPTTKNYSCENNRVQPRMSLAIVGGSRVGRHQSAPYMAALGGRTKNGSVEWYCGGSLVSPTAVLTAAHCVLSRTIDVVRVGTPQLCNQLTPNDYPVAATIPHEDYRSPSSYHDVAIVKLLVKVPLSDSATPICLSTDTTSHVGTTAQVLGWGAETMGGTGSSSLRQVALEVVSNTRCDNAYANSSIQPRNFPDGIKSSQLCAGSPEGGKDACQGDSGGPLVLQDNDGVIRQIGVVSSGAGCGQQLFPGVYIRVSSYAEWVKRTMKRGGRGVETPTTEGPRMHFN